MILIGKGRPKEKTMYWNRTHPTTISQYPFQPGSSLSAADINYNSLKVADAMKHLQELESLTAPSN